MEYTFKLQVVCGARRSDWTEEKICIPGAVSRFGLGGFAGSPMWALARMVATSLTAVARARLGYRRNVR